MKKEGFAFGFEITDGANETNKISSRFYNTDHYIGVLDESDLVATQIPITATNDELGKRIVIGPKQI
jgi:hypothetical protein